MIQLTARDFEILEVLTRRVRVLTLDQVARTWWQPSPISNSNAASRLKLLGHSQLIKLHRAPAHPELPLEEPVWEGPQGSVLLNSIAFVSSPIALDTTSSDDNLRGRD